MQEKLNKITLLKMFHRQLCFQTAVEPLFDPDVHNPSEDDDANGSGNAVLNGNTVFLYHVAELIRKVHDFDWEDRVKRYSVMCPTYVEVRGIYCLRKEGAVDKWFYHRDTRELLLESGDSLLRPI
jgi:hypothetical protein